MASIVNLYSDPKLKFEEWGHGTAYSGSNAEIAKLWQTEKLGFHLEILYPGFFSCPYHSHQEEEELFLILEGSGLLREDDEYFEIHAGDLIFFKTGVSHQFFNPTDHSMLFFALSNKAKNELCKYPDSNKTMMSGEVRKIFQNGVEIQDYWQGEEDPLSKWPGRYQVRAKTGPRLTTDRTLCRLADASEAAQIAEFYSINWDHLKAWNPTAPEDFFTEAYWKKRLHEEQREFYSGKSLRLKIYAREDSHLIGMINFVNFERGVFQNCRLGYHIAKAYEGKGLMMEALKEGIRYIFEDLKFHRIEANYIPANARSEALLKGLGFERNGLAKNYLQIDGKWQDHILTSLLASSSR